MTPALAQQGGGMMSPEQRGQRFDTADANKDGKLTKAEWLTIIPDQMKERADQVWANRFDADGDGFVSKEQFLAQQGRGQRQ
jgi:hypothetical protein